MNTATKVTVDVHRLAHHLRVARDGYASSAKALQGEGYGEGHPFVQLFFDLINECTELSDALNECVRITVNNNDDDSVITIHQ